MLIEDVDILLDRVQRARLLLVGSAVGVACGGTRGGGVLVR
jgi:hypothetical protein